MLLLTTDGPGTRGLGNTRLLTRIPCRPFNDSTAYGGLTRTARLSSRRAGRAVCTSALARLKVFVALLLPQLAGLQIATADTVIHSAKAPVTVEVPLGPAREIVTASIEQRRSIVSSAVHQLVAAGDMYAGRLVVLSVAGASISFGSLEISERQWLQARLGADAAARYESNLAAILEDIMEELEEESSDVSFAVRGLPVEPGVDGPEAARQINERYRGVIDVLDELVSAHSFFLLRSGVAEEEKVRMAMPEAIRLRSGRVVLFRTNGLWRKLAGDVSRDIDQELGQTSNDRVLNLEPDIVTWQDAEGLLAGTDSDPSIALEDDVIYQAALAFFFQSPLRVFSGENPNDRFGFSVSAAGDLNNDGTPDIVVGAPRYDNGATVDSGRAYVFSATGGSPLRTLTGLREGIEVGYSVAGGADVDNDGWDDIMVGAPRRGSGGLNERGVMWIFSGLTEELIGGNRGEGAGDRFGSSVAFVGDVDSDGFEDYVVGAWGSDEGGANTGRAYLFSGLTDELLWMKQGEGLGDRFGTSVAAAGDVDADGVPDVIIGASRNRSNGLDAGAAYVYSGSGAIIRSFRGNQGDQFGIAVAGAGDVDGDGKDDVIVGAPGAGNTGAAYVYSVQGGQLIGGTLSGDNPGDKFGRSVNRVGDVNGDGKDEVIVGAPRAGANGAAYVYSVQGGERLITLTGEFPEDRFGFPVSGIDDVNGDGIRDILVGAWRNPSGEAFGRVYLFSGSPGDHGGGDGCTLTNAYWNVNTNTSTEGTVVQLVVEGTNCAGETVSFEVLEWDGPGDAADPVQTNPPSVTFSGAMAVGQWQAEWQEDIGGPFDGPEYYFVASQEADPSNSILSPTDEGGLLHVVQGSASDGDGDGIGDDVDNCPNTFNPGQEDSDGDGAGNACDDCSSDPDKVDPGVCGCGVADTDSDGDLVPDCIDGCADDPDKVDPGICGCGIPDIDSDADGVPDCNDICAGFDDNIDSDGDGIPDGCDPSVGCPSSGPTWQNAGIAPQDGLFTVEYDSTPHAANMDGLTTLSLGAGSTFNDFACLVRFNPNGIIQARNGNGYSSDTQITYTPGTTYHFRVVVNVPQHTYTTYVTPPGSPEVVIANDYAFRSTQSAVASLDNWGLWAGTGSHEVCNFEVTQSSGPPGEGDCNNNGIPDGQDIASGTSDDCNGNGLPDECESLQDTDGDGCPDCVDVCPNDPDKCVDEGMCGCNESEADSDGDLMPDCLDDCKDDPDKIDPGECGCGVPDTDSDGDGVADCHDQCPGEDDSLDTDGDGIPDCNDGCPDDRHKVSPGDCGCGIPDTPNCDQDYPTVPIIFAGSGWSGPTQEPPPIGSPQDTGYDAKVIAHWDVVPHQTFDGDFEVGVVAFHINDVDRVEFAANGGPWTPVYEMTLNSRTGVVEYWATLRASDFPDGLVEVRAIAYPKNAGQPRLLSYDHMFSGGPEVVGCKLYANSGGTLPGEVRFVQAGHSLATAAQQIANAQAGNAGGGTIYLNPGDYSIGSLGVNITDRWLTIAGAPGTTREQVRITSGHGVSMSGLVHFKDLSITVSIDGDDAGWADGIIMQGANFDHHRYFDGFPNGTFVTDSTFKDLRQPLTKVFLKRNVELINIGRDLLRWPRLVVNVVAKDHGYLHDHSDFLSWGFLSFENIILYNVASYDADQITQGIYGDSFGQFLQWDNIACVNVHIDRVGLTSVRGQWIGIHTNHFLLWNITHDKINMGLFSPNITNLSVKGGVWENMLNNQYGSSFEDNHFITGNTWGAGYTTGDPGWVNPSANDYRPRPGSILIDRLNDPLVPVDLNNAPRATPGSLGSDLGAFEHQ